MIDKISKTYDQLRDENLWLYYNDYEPGKRTVEVKQGDKKFILFSSNNYLGLSRSQKVIKEAIKAIKKYGVGTGASLAVTGGTAYHKALEENLAKFYGYEDAIVLSSGYMANKAVISGLADKNTVAFCDKFLHKSFFNAFKLNDVEFIRFKHNDSENLEARIIEEKNKRDIAKILIISESIFSQHGGIAKVDLLSRIADKYKAILIIDDAHGLGTIGENGKGILEYFKLTSSDVDIITGAMNKSLGSQGGYILASKRTIELIEEKASELIFTSSLPAVSMAAANVALSEIGKNKKLYSKLRENIAYCRKSFEEIGIEVPKDFTPIIPIVIGDEKVTCQISRDLKDAGIIAMPIIPPGVPIGASRIRVQITASHEKKDIDRLTQALKSCLIKYKVS